MSEEDFIPEEEYQTLEEIFAEELESKKQTLKDRVPFKFLDSYTSEDRDIFFGRDGDINALYSAFYRSKLLVVYGESGVGKTSLLECGLRNEIPEINAVFFTVRCAVDPIASLRSEILRVVKDADFPDGKIPSDTREFLDEAAFSISKTVVLLFDQFEEFFIFQGVDARKEFVNELSTWLKNRLDIKVIICIREDYYAKLTELEEAIPNIYKNRYWVRRLSSEQGEEALIKPCKVCGVTFDIELAGKLAKDLMIEGKGVDLPTLQIVADRLYNEAKKESVGNIDINLALYQRIGKMRSILNDFIENRISAYLNAEDYRQVLKAMVTTEGIKKIGTIKAITHDARLYNIRSLGEGEVEKVLNNLISDRVIRIDRDNTMYELMHDSLAGQIRAWMKEHEVKLTDISNELEFKFKEYKSRDTLLDKNTLEYIEPYEDGLKLSSEMKTFVAKSKSKQILDDKKNIAARATLTAEAYIRDGNVNRERSEWAIALIYYKESLTLHEEAAGKIGAIDAMVHIKPELANFIGHANGILSVTFSPEGKQLASGALDCLIKLWDLETGNLINTLSGHMKGVRSVAFSPNGKQLVSGALDCLIKLWDLETGSLINTLSVHTGDVYSVVFSPDGKKLASGSEDKTINLWDVKTGNLLKTLSEHTKAVMSVAFSPDGKQLASGSLDSTIKLWNVETGSLFKTLSGHTECVYSIAFSPDGKQLASGAWDYTIKLWEVEDAETGNLFKTLSGHTDSVYSVVFSPNGKQLASGARDRTIKLWDVENSNLIKTLSGHTDCIRAISFSPNAELLASGASDSTIKLWDVETDNLIKGHKGSVRSVVFSPDGKQLVSGSRDHAIKLWDVKTGNLIKTLSEHKEAVWSVAFSPNGKQLASGSWDSTIKLWDVKTGNLIKTLSGHTNHVFSVVFSPNGKQLASGSWDSTIKLWDVKTGNLIKTLSGHTNHVFSVVFSPNGKQLASGSWDSTIKLWDVKTGNLIKTLSGHTETVRSVAFSPNGKQLASGPWDRTIKLWNVETGNLIKTLYRHTKSVYSVAFSPNGRQLASGSCDRTIKLWDIGTGKEVITLYGHAKSVNSVAFSPDGKQLASGSSDSTIKLWTIDTGDFPSLKMRIQTYTDIAIPYELDANGMPTVRDMEELTRKRLEAAKKGEIPWLPDGGKSHVHYYENTLQQIKSLKEEEKDKKR
ncbi:repeat-containing protein [Candidatus Magnetobacterium bavaricum]|uniref:Repeat-containing protein n=1 Tax=Candidatus Magnetobacterium bavaricum TaxID=29290 RepID=A0A0F3GI57_9BACT|nr:repeat-containing protein [Candidatus Magnetobacterium bavaricum]